MRINDWHDIVRLATLLMAFCSLYLLGSRFKVGHKEWNTKTRDYWFASVLWMLASIVLSVEGLLEDRPLEPRLVCYFLATALTLKALLRKEEWGGRE